LTKTRGRRGGEALHGTKKRPNGKRRGRWKSVSCTRFSLHCLDTSEFGNVLGKEKGELTIWHKKRTKEDAVVTRHWRKWKGGEEVEGVHGPYGWVGKSRQA